MGLIFKEGFSFSGFERNALYLNQEGNKFLDISGVSGIDSILDTRAVVLADFDNDGDLDAFLTAIQDQGHLLYRNNVGQDSNFIRIELVGAQSGTDALGAVVRVKTSAGVQSRMLTGGSGFMSQHDSRLLFGLGGSSQAEWVEVTWPSGRFERFGPVKAGTSLRLEEESHQREVVVDSQISLPGPLHPAQEVWQSLAIKPGDPLPPDLIKGAFTFQPGQRYLVNFWATFCAPCRKEMPELQGLLPRFHENGIEVVGVSLDEDLNKAVDFARSLAITYPIVKANPVSVQEIFGPEVFIPMTLLVDESGKVVESFQGWNEDTRRRIEQLLEAPTPLNGPK